MTNIPDALATDLHNAKFHNKFCKEMYIWWRNVNFLFIRDAWIIKRYVLIDMLFSEAVAVT